MSDNNTDTVDSLDNKVTTPIASLTIGLTTALALVTVLNGFVDFKKTINHMVYLQEVNQATVLGAVRSNINRQNPEVALPQNLEPIESNRIIVKFKEGTKLPPGLQIAAERANLERAQGLRHVLTINGIDAQVYEVDEDDMASEVVNRLLATKGDIIEYAEVDMLVPPAYIPNDPNLSSAWHINKIEAPLAWDSSNGSDIIIAIADTGVNCNHVDLAANCVSGWNTASNNAETSDIHGHGTAVSGAAAQVGDNGVGSAGVAYNAKIMPMRVTDSSDGRAYFSAIANAFTWAADRGARVANASYGVCASASVLNSAKYLRSKGGIAVAAAMNNGEDPGFTNSEFITCVSATASNDTRTSWSNFGAYVDVSAPGAGIYLTRVGGGYGTGSGTSFSAPITAGIYALMFAANPALTPLQADNILFSTADDLGEAGWDKYYGHGRVNAGKAVQLAVATIGTRDTVPPSTPTNLRYSDLRSDRVTLDWNPSTDDNSGVAGYSVFRNGTKVVTVAGTRFTNTGLSPNTAYTYTVRAEDVEGNISPDSTPLSITTPDVDFGIINHSVPTKTNNSATIAVNLTKPGTVVVNYGTRSNTLDMSVSSTNLNDTHSLNLSGLSAKTTYYYQVVATGQNGEVVTSAVSNFKTSGGGGGGNEKGGGNTKNR